jgi:hypothetical protein
MLWVSSLILIIYAFANLGIILFFLQCKGEVISDKF